MHSNVMLRFLVQVLQNPPLCSSTAVHGFRVHCTYLADYGGKYEGMVVAPVPPANLRKENNSKNHHHCHFKHNHFISLTPTLSSCPLIFISSLCVIVCIVNLLVNNFRPISVLSLYTVDYCETHKTNK